MAVTTPASARVATRVGVRARSRRPKPGTALLVALIAAVIDNRNQAPGANMGGWIIGFVVVGIGLSYGVNAGYAINPARDFGPRVASALLGWGTAVFRSHGGYFWVPIVAPLIGGVAGIWLYDLGIGRFLPPAEEPSPPGRVSP